MNIELTDKFKILHADEGMRITDWDRQDILDWSYCTHLYTSPLADTSMYYEVTEQEAVELDKQQEEALEDADGQR